MIELTLPYPPNVNHYKRVGRLTRTKSGKLYQPRVNSDVTKHYFWQVWMKIQKEGLKSFGSATISVELDVYPPDRRKRDLDGVLKVFLDSMQKGGLYDDDYQIARLLVTRCSTIPEGQIIVRIKPL
jgi:crossover junction endodeoxyribonuclease RusA